MVAHGLDARRGQLVHGYALPDTEVKSGNRWPVCQFHMKQSTQASGHSEIRLSSADDPHPAKADSEAGTASNDARLTREKIRDFLRILARQIAIFVRSAAQRGQVFWRHRRAAIAGASLRDRWSGLQARLQPWTRYVRWPNLDLK